MADLPIKIDENMICISKWCVRCYPDKKEPAVFIYGGHSLCEKCFRWFLIALIKPQNWGNDGRITDADIH